MELFWYCDGHSRPHGMERVLPNGSMQLAINLRPAPVRVYDRACSSRFESYGGCVLGGAYSEPILLDGAAQGPLLGVHFKPGGAFPFLGGVPAGELHNLHVPLDAIWGRMAGELRERLLEAETPAAMFRILEHLLEGARADDRRHPAVAQALEEFQRIPHGRRIADLTEDIGLSSRRFIEVFKDQVGMTPKRYCRVRRFQEALRLIGGETRLEWTQLALACGYYDQAHMIHDFRELSGITPTTYSALRGEHRNHVPLTVE